jgi:tripartite-type tricarboxylate transporter receptor subunit TctC
MKAPADSFGAREARSGGNDKRLVAALALTFAATAALAQPNPSRPITLIVPFPPGGSTDTVARIMAERMRPILGQPVIIENVGGAGGSIAVGRVARAAPEVEKWWPIIQAAGVKAE